MKTTNNKKVKDTRNNALSTLLKKYHTGMERSISGRELELALGINRNTIQKQIHKLRMEGVPICSSNAGYFYAETRQELTETASRFNQRIRTMVQTENQLLNTMPDEKEEIEFLLPNEGLKVSFNIKSIRRDGC